MEREVVIVPVIRMDGESSGEVSDAKEEVLATELTASCLEP